MLSLRVSILAAVLASAAGASPYTVVVDAPLSAAQYIVLGFPVGFSGVINGTITAEAQGGSLFQDGAGNVHVPIGYSGPLTIDLVVRFTNDLGYAAVATDLFANGFSLSLGPVGLIYPASPATFAYTWLNLDPATFSLAPGASHDQPLVRWELIGAFGPVVSGEYELQAGDQSQLYWTARGEGLSAVPEPSSWALACAGLSALAVLFRRRH